MAYEREEWHPVTGLGKLVASGEIKNIDQVLESGRPIKEPQIVDQFLPDLEDEVLDIAMMQRMTDSGRRVQFRAVVIVANRNGYIGFGQGKDVQVGDAIKKAIVKAKMILIKVQRGCGSWESPVGAGRQRRRMCHPVRHRAPNSGRVLFCGSHIYHESAAHGD